MDKAAFRLDFQATKAVEGEEAGVKGVIIEGYASTFEEDRDQEIVDRRAFDTSFRNYFETNPVMLYDHGNDPDLARKPIGHMTAGRVDQRGLRVKGFLPEPDSGFTAMREVYDKVKAGILRTFSIGGLFARVGKVITEIDLYEISIVSIPSNRGSLFEVVAKAFASDSLRDKGPITDAHDTNALKSSLWEASMLFADVVAAAIAEEGIADAEKVGRIRAAGDELTSIALSIAGNIQAIAAAAEPPAEQALPTGLSMTGAEEAGSKAGAVLSAANMTELEGALENIGAVIAKLNAVLDKARKKEDEGD